MSASPEDRSGRRWLATAFRRMVRWAWERDEVDQTVTGETVLFRVLQYALLFGVSLAAGGVLWVLGQRDTAMVVWLVWIAFTVFFGTIAVGWDLLVFVSNRREHRREGSEDGDGDEREPAGRARAGLVAGSEPNVAAEYEPRIAAGSEPEFAPDISVARDTKISFVVTLFVLALIVAVTVVAEAVF